MKKVLISGGSRGIGAACTEKFRAAGDDVVFIYKNSREAAEALCSRTGARSICADVSDPKAAAAALHRAAELMGGLDTLVCCAGVAHIAQICDCGDEDWRRVCDTDLGSTFTLCREASKIMVKAHSGSIINIGSI